MPFDILLVDDNSIQAATRKAILSRLNCSISIAENGARALEILDREKSVALVITDHLMPAMNGPIFVAELRRRLPRVPVLVLSGMAEAEDEYEDMDVIFRVKPLPPDELLQLVRSLLDEPIARSA